MTRVGRIAKGIGAFVLLVALVVGIPSALWHFVGWPLPHQFPSWSGLGHDLAQHGIPDRTLVDALAVAVWLTWAVLMASVVTEASAAIGGRSTRRLPLAGAFQPLTGRLIATLFVAVLALSPRPAHASASSLGGIARAGGHQPVAALVLTDATAAVLTSSMPKSTTSHAPVAVDDALPAVAPAASNVAERTYVVKRGDTLWGIAERELGDPLRWSELYRLNAGRPQRGGRTLTDANWIDPGWTLVLPASAESASTHPTPPFTTHVSAMPPTTTPPVTTVPATTVPATIVPVTSEPPASVTAPASTRGDRVPLRPHEAEGDGAPAAPVRLPSGSMVAGSFVAGVLSAVALGRLRRRHAYRYRPPEPGRDLTPKPLRPTLRHLAHPSDPDPDADHEDTNDPEAIPFTAFDDTERRQNPGRLDLGTHNGTTVTVEVTDLSGIAICGPATDDVARALVAGLLVRAGPGAAEVLFTARLAGRLFPGLDPDRAIRRAKTTDDLARSVEAEMIARTRRFDATEAPDAISYRAANPENPLPLLVVLLDEVAEASVGRWAALAGGAARLGIAVVFLGESPVAAGGLVANASRTVTDAAPPALAERLAGIELFGLRADEAVELLGAVADSHGADLDDDEDTEVDEPITVLRLGGPVDQAPRPSERGEEPWTEPALAEEGPDRPIVVQMLGPFRITVHGEPVTTGLRRRAKALFAWYLVCPEGATSDEAVDALWPDTDPEQVRKQFWRPFGDLRARFRGPGDEALDVLTKTGEHYQPSAAEIACDLWEFQAALAEAARASTDDQARAALRRAVDTYRGDLLQGSDYPWVEPVRQDLHRRALDAHLRLAELEDHAGRPDAAVDTLERTIDLDRYAEEPYRRLMALHAAHGRIDAVTATWKLLQARLAELDLDMEPTTTRLYRSLTASDTVGAHRIRLSS